MMEIKQNRFKSPVLWGAIVAQVLAVFVTLGVLDPLQSEAINEVVIGVLQLLAVFGILNNPTNKAGV